ncbi:MAG: hypothetical protein BGO98_27535 [Myxococcales bacterium 68-20]|nr:MAG: hypothetical protein BGO98_27535 [Myxococcales bacterium 68-20]
MRLLLASPSTVPDALELEMYARLSTRAVRAASTRILPPLAITYFAACTRYASRFVAPMSLSPALQ